jgi:hypothetical protein
MEVNGMFVKIDGKFVKACALGGAIFFLLGGCVREWMFEKRIHKLYSEGYKFGK